MCVRVQWEADKGREENRVDGSSPRCPSHFSLVLTLLSTLLNRGTERVVPISAACVRRSVVHDEYATAIGLFSVVSLLRSEILFSLPTLTISLGRDRGRLCESCDEKLIPRQIPVLHRICQRVVGSHDGRLLPPIFPIWDDKRIKFFSVPC